MSDPYNLSRFVEAQTGVYSGVVEELKRGTKTGHWIWFIFPQIKGLGRSGMSRRFSISSIEEAKAYCEHPILASRLLECTELVMTVEGKSAQQILGHIDALKFRSCLTLFAIARNDETLFQRALDKYFDGARDPLTLQSLEGATGRS
jgi:uncharacterized protein (DUF1810 family)